MRGALLAAAIWYNECMDTKTLAVGQEVWVESGCYGYKGKVVEIGPGGVRVETDGGGPFWFDDDGKSSDGRSGTREGGPWCIAFHE